MHPLSHRRRPARRRPRLRRPAACPAARSATGGPGLAVASPRHATKGCRARRSARKRLLAACEDVLADTVEYCKQRQQFGAADRQLPGAAAPDGRYVTWRLEQAGRRGLLAVLNPSRAEPEDSRAGGIGGRRRRSARAARFIGQQAVQLHGGMGMTEKTCDRPLTSSG